MTDFIVRNGIKYITADEGRVHRSPYPGCFYLTLVSNDDAGQETHTVILLSSESFSKLSEAAHEYISISQEYDA